MFKVIICGVVKNADKYLRSNIERAIELGQCCDKYKIVLYENNSTDGTKAILGSYADNPALQILSEDIEAETIKRESKIWAYTQVTGSDHPCRVEQIANARNKIINELQKEVYEDYNYVVMLDFDSRMFLIDGILDSLRLVKENQKRVIYANSEKYYDYYALRSTHSEYNLFGPELMGEYFWKLMSLKPLQIDSNQSTLVPVYSAFNGIGVYSKDIFTSHFFDPLPTPATKSIYNKIITSQPVAYAKYKSVIQNSCPKFPGGERDELFYWKNNSGYNKPVICEHVAFNFALIRDGCEIFINPRMLYWWS
jgi:hypothetical protein